MPLRNEFEDVALLRSVWRIDDGNDSMTPAERSAYRSEADKFLSVTSRMAELEWTQHNHSWLAKRNRSALMATEEGRRELEQFDGAPLLMDGRRKNAAGEDGAEQFNAQELRRLSIRTGRPIAAIAAYHDRPKSAPDLKPEKFNKEEFSGLKAHFEVCEGARVLLTTNEWVEAGLMNGALGWVRGFMWPDGGNPASEDPRLRAPLCIFVEFDDVQLGLDHTGEERTFFPDNQEKRRWIPVYRHTAYAVSEESVARKQFPLVLAWALTHWKAQGMTLIRARVSLGKRAAGISGIGYVAITRVTHPRHLVFETDLPAWECIQEARHTEGFRARRRFDLRNTAKFSRTIRKYGFCEADVWTRPDAERGDRLLKGLRAKGQRQRITLSATGCPTDEDAWVWPGGEPAFDKLLAEQVEDISAGNDAEHRALVMVAERLRGELHMPAVREVLG